MTKVPTFITMKGVALIANCSRATAWRYAGRPDFPKPLYFSPSRPMWIKDDVIEWCLRRPNRPGL